MVVVMVVFVFVVVMVVVVRFGESGDRRHRHSRTKNDGCNNFLQHVVISQQSARVFPAVGTNVRTTGVNFKTSVEQFPLTSRTSSQWKRGAEERIAA